MYKSSMFVLLMRIQMFSLSPCVCFLLSMWMMFKLCLLHICAVCHLSTTRGEEAQDGLVAGCPPISEFCRNVYNRSIIILIVFKPLDYIGLFCTYNMLVLYFWPGRWTSLPPFLFLKFLSFFHMKEVFCIRSQGLMIEHVIFSIALFKTCLWYLAI